MQRSRIILIVTLLILLVVGMFVFAYLMRGNQAQAPQPSQTETTQQSDPYEDITRITAKHYYTDSLQAHTLAGEIPMPTACDLLTTNAVLLDNDSRVLVSFDVINNSPQECEQKVTPQRFKIGFKAPKDIKIDATFKGRPVELNLVPAKDGENPQDFELMIKG